MPWPKEWPNANACDEILPPIMRVQLGHQKKKTMRRATDEPTNPYKISRNGYVVTSGKCEGRGHNYKGCHLPENPN
jgi:hypothetical protein